MKNENKIQNKKHTLQNLEKMQNFNQFSFSHIQILELLNLKLNFFFSPKRAGKQNTIKILSYLFILIHWMTIFMCVYCFSHYFNLFSNYCCYIYHLCINYFILLYLGSSPLEEIPTSITIPTYQPIHPPQLCTLTTQLPSQTLQQCIISFQSRTFLFLEQ
ncbi:unnamed protein product [Paramecium octaurelia]|uniref:Transmembrane protein n=1 Tax=Paramecium octaurelia TaxID=43137 RepID=A0A8S1VU56_PAROT|nr:unnamed protein product [Paramecium octaurelia]